MNKRLFVAVVWILVLAAFALPTPALDASAGLFQSPLPVTPPNDDFDNATVILEIPYGDVLDTTNATWASDDPWDCTSNGSVWYAFTPSSDVVIEANTFGSDYDTVLSVYTGSRGALAMVPGACNDDYQNMQSRVRFEAAAGTTYYFLVGFCCGSGENGGGSLVFNVEEIAGPENDLFVNALPIDGLPYQHMVDNSGATVEAGEPWPPCAGDPLAGTVWYAYTPAQSGSVSGRVDAWFPIAVAAYTGSSVSSLTEVASQCWSDWLTFYAEAGTTYYFQVGGMWGETGSLTFYLDVPPPPEAEFWFYPENPSVFDNVWFDNFSWDPGQVGFESQAWDLGDGTTSTDWSTSHRYAADGDYTVQLTVNTYDGRSASTSRDVHVRTHDVAITKFSTPGAASAGQTRPIAVGLTSKRYPEQVEVQLFKSVPGGYEWVGSLTQYVPVRQANRTTDFRFSYTFTSDDAVIGKVTFRAMANIYNAQDALPADNEAIATPTKVR